MIVSLVAVMCTMAEPALHVASSPRSAHLIRVALLSPEQIENAPVESLTLPQLQVESARLAEAPSIAPPVALLAAGGGAFFVFGTLTYLCFTANTRSDPLGAIFLAFLGVLTGI